MYKVVLVLEGGMLLVIEHPEYGEQLWSLCKLTKKHKGDACAMCEAPVGDHAYRPITNASNRMKRICTLHAMKEVHHARSRKVR